MVLLVLSGARVGAGAALQQSQARWCAQVCLLWTDKQFNTPTHLPSRRENSPTPHIMTALFGYRISKGAVNFHNEKNLQPGLCSI